MKCTFIVAALLSFSLHSAAQNLVPNPSFEDFNACPFNHTNIDYSPGYNLFPFVQAWVSPTESTPDYYNRCASGTTVDIPDNLFGMQETHSGDAYTGMYYWISGQDYREYLQAKLTQPLQAGKQYYVSMYISNSVPAFAAGIFDVVGIYDIGINLSASHNTQMGITPMYLAPTISQPTGQYLTDTAGWVKVKGLYTASGGEEWITIGNFLNSPNVPSVLVYDCPDTFKLCYMFLDDVSVRPINDTIIAMHDTIICNQNFPITLYAPVTNSDIHLWSTGDTSAVISVNSGGIYWKHSWNDSTLFIDSFIVAAPSTSPLPLDLGPDTSFCGNHLTIAANHDYLNYNWNTGASTKSITVNSSGQYILTVTDSCGTSDKDTVNVVLKPMPPAPHANDTAVCVGDNVSLNVSGQNVLWYTTPGGAGSPVPPAVNTSVSGLQTLYVSQTIDGCESPKKHFKITVTAPPRSLGSLDTSICTEHSIMIGAEQDNANYTWSTGQIDCCISISKPGTYMLTTYNNCGTVSDSFRLETFNCTNCIIAPTAFTPNADGLNDKYRVKARCLLGEFYIAIYNRFGEQVFETSDINEGWDGIYKGQPADIGAYYFYIKYRVDMPNAKDEIIKGDITLIR